MRTFHDPYFKFSIDIPGHWHFMAAAWSPMEMARRRAEAGSEEEAWLAFASTPFCCAMTDHGVSGKEKPTLQVTARRCRVPGDAEARAALAFQTDLLRDDPQDFVVERATHEASIASHRANVLQVSSVARVEHEGLVAEVGVRSRLYVVFTPGIAFNLCLSSSDDPAYYDEADFDAIIASVRVGD